MNLTKTRNTTKYLAIKELSDENKTYSISALCEFAGIARSAYYKWLGHVNSDNDNLNERIADTITKIHDEHPDMGYRRIRDTLAHDYKIAVNDKRVLRICRKKKIQSYIKHRYNCCTKPASDPAYVAENILNREFKSDMINQKWVTDISEFKYGVGEDNKKGKLYLSVILIYAIGGLSLLYIAPEMITLLFLIDLTKLWQRIQELHHYFIVIEAISIRRKHLGGEF